MRFFLLLSFYFFFNLCLSQDSQVKSQEKFEYQINGYILLNKYDKKEKSLLLNESIEAGRFLYNVIGEYKYKEDDKEFKYVLLEILKFKRSIGSVKNTDGTPTEKLKLYFTDKEKIIRSKDSTIEDPSSDYYEIENRTDYIDIGDQDEIFWIKEEKFDELIEKGYIKKRYHLTPQFAYGASLTIPFKIRPETRDLNMKITPEISLGGYLGMRGRLSRYKSIYWYLPVITAGVTTIGINKDNVISEQEVSDDTTKDALVLARTFSVGSFIEFNSFQIGAVIGWDKAGGEIGKDWIYNDRLWYSFSIGYNFLRKKDD